MKILIKDTKTGKWIEVESVNYKVESDLQALIANSPSIIPVEEIMNGAPPFVLGVREFGLPGSGNTDILLFNEDGNIGVIECKLASNAEIKRKVIGQILEYAAFLWTTSYEDLDAKVKVISGSTLVEGLSKLAEKPDWDANQFREDVQQNLKNGTFNLIVAVDHINEELKQPSITSMNAATRHFHSTRLSFTSTPPNLRKCLFPICMARFPKTRLPQLLVADSGRRMDSLRMHSGTRLVTHSS